MTPLTFFKIAFVYIKKYWWVGAAIAGFILFEVIFRTKASSDLASTLEAIQKRHDEELNAIKGADEARRKAYEENNRILQMRLAEIERQAAEAQVQLDSKKRSELEKILKDTNNDPDALAQKLSDATGFKVIVP